MGLRRSWSLYLPFHCCRICYCNRFGLKSCVRMPPETDPNCLVTYYSKWVNLCESSTHRYRLPMPEQSLLLSNNGYCIQAATAFPVQSRVFFVSCRWYKYRHWRSAAFRRAGRQAVWCNSSFSLKILSSCTVGSVIRRAIQYQAVVLNSFCT